MTRDNSLIIDDSQYIKDVEVDYIIQVPEEIKIKACNLTTNAGNIESLVASNYHVHTDCGNFDVDFKETTEGHRSKISSNAGIVRMRNIRNTVSVNVNSGEVIAYLSRNLHPNAQIDLHSDAGNVQVYTGKTIDACITGETSAGTICTWFNRPRSNSFVGDSFKKCFGNGTAKINATSSAGNIIFDTYNQF